jgi:HCOMODA/2-hydroxy-3-carboxy-muconic semialdehyde decarboxylase
MKRERSIKSDFTVHRALTGVALVLAVALMHFTPPVGAQQDPVSVGPADPALIEDLIAANRILYQQGIVDGFGHVSVRHDQNPNRFLMSRSLAPELVTADDLIEYDLDGVGVNLGGRGQYSERFIHAEIYRARPDVHAVVHNHSPGIVPFTVSPVPLRPVYHMAAFIGEGIPLFDLRDAAGITEMLVNNPDRGRALAKVLGDRPAVLIRGHGVAVVGRSLPFAVGRSVYLELNARVQAQAIALGGSVTYLDPREAQAVLDAGENRRYERPWEMWKRQAMKQ